MSCKSFLLACVAFLTFVSEVRVWADEPFGIQLARGIEKIEQVHSNPVTREDLARWAIEGIFGKSWAKVPSEVVEGVRGADLSNRHQLAKVLQEARDRLGDRKELLDQEDLRAAYDGIFAGVESGGQLEWRSSYMTKKELSEFVHICHAYTLSGVGLKIVKDSKADVIRVVTPIFDSPAYRAGIRAGDQITHITRYSPAENGKPEEKAVYSTKGMQIGRAIELLLGRPGTSITLTVIPTPGVIVAVRDSKISSDE